VVRAPDPSCGQRCAGYVAEVIHVEAETRCNVQPESQGSASLSRIVKAGSNYHTRTAATKIGARRDTESGGSVGLRSEGSRRYSSSRGANSKTLRPSRVSPRMCKRSFDLGGSDTHYWLRTCRKASTRNMVDTSRPSGLALQMSPSGKSNVDPLRRATMPPRDLVIVRLGVDYSSRTNNMMTWTANSMHSPRCKPSVRRMRMTDGLANGAEWTTPVHAGI